MRIGLDFDRVLFDTDSFDEYYKKETGLYHVDADVFDQNGNYDPVKHAKICGVDKEKVWNALNDLEKFIYEDVEQLKNLNGHELVIVTRGNREFQKKKMQGSNIWNYINEYTIIEEGPKSKAEIDFLVDDSIEELQNADIEGYHFERPEDTIQDLLDFINGESS